MPRRTSQWQRAAETLAAAIPKGALHPAVVRWADGRPAERWTIAFSGGADSLALLLLVWAHWPERRNRLLAVHFNHRLRGRAADADERFCVRVCSALKVRIRIGRWKDAPDKVTEAQARTARHAFFAKELQRRGGNVLWLGHQCDDIAETMLMRLARGSGLSGLAAPRPVQHAGGDVMHVRPLLSIGKERLERALSDAGASWRNDATNATGAFLRNRIRHAVLPAWREAVADRDFLGGVALARERIEEDDAALEAWVASLRPVGARGELRLAALRGKPRAVTRRALQQWLAQHGRAGAISRQAFERLLDDVMQPRVTRHSIGAALFAEVSKRAVKIVAAESARRNSTARPIDL